MVRSWLAIAALTCGCAHRPATIENACASPRWQELAAGPVPSPTPTGIDAMIGEVVIEGVSPVVAATLRSQLRTKPGTPIVAAPIDDDLARLVALGMTGGARVDVRERGATADVAFVIAPQPLVGEVTLAGPSPRALELRRMSWLTGTPFEPARFSRMAMAVQRSFVRDGYDDARVIVRDRPRREAATVDVCVAAALGPRVVIRAFRFPGRSGVAEKKLVAAIASKGGIDSIGSPYDADKLDAALPAIEGVYFDHGYPAIRVDPPRVRRIGDALEVEVPVHEGKRFKLGALTVTSAYGPLRVPVRLMPGDWFSRKHILAEKERLAELTGGDVQPIVSLDFDHTTVALEFSVEWESPWDALHALPLLSSR